MLTTLIASRSRHTNSFRAQALSIGLHAALIAGAVLVTQRAAAVLEPAVAEPVTYVRPAPDPTPPTVSPASRVPPLKGFQLVLNLVAIPDVLPPIDVGRALTDPRDFTGAGLPGGRWNGANSVIDISPRTIDQVDTPARLVPGTGRPAYPDALRSAGLAGEVNVQFVVDSTGRADMRTLEILSSTHPRFSDAAKRALEHARFMPAEFGGRKVPQLVRMPFVFSLQR